MEKCSIQTRYVMTSTGTGKNRVVKYTPVADYLKEQEQQEP